MPDVFSETTSTSWFSRMKNAIIGVFIGMLLVPGSMFLLFWNESRAIRETYRLNEGESNVNRDVPIDTVNPAMEGKLVHVAGLVHALEPVSDPDFQLTRDAIQLRRNVEMYQWEEHKDTKTRKKMGGGRERTTDYSYSLDWHSDRVDSSDFKQETGHENPGLPFTSQTDITSKAELGAFEFPDHLLRSIHGWETLKLDDAWFQSLPEKVQTHSVVHDNQLFYNELGTPDPNQPKLGDVRLKFQLVPDSDITLVASQSSNSFREFPTKYGGLELLQMGKMSADEVFKRAHDANTTWTWILRGGGFILMGVGFCLMMKPLSTFASIIPFLENIAGFGIAIVGFGLAFVLSSITIAVAWVAVRPILAISLFAMAGVAVGALIYFRSGKKTESEPPYQNPKSDHGVELL